MNIQKAIEEPMNDKVMSNNKHPRRVRNDGSDTRLSDVVEVHRLSTATGLAHFPVDSPLSKKQPGKSDAKPDERSKGLLSTTNMLTIVTLVAGSGCARREVGEGYGQNRRVSYIWVRVGKEDGGMHVLRMSLEKERFRETGFVRGQTLATADVSVRWVMKLGLDWQEAWSRPLKVVGSINVSINTRTEESKSVW
ncbi:hypothetical protein FIBSPDRAFT_897060 [Athelia psychrophila]|uniref:Uncharacterized protein n=1 Tax=Athelia psychrophila TaxID=1759441 RepID=A0A166CQ19_9AGAM|nr:hypothetical protein FIBSPDRAFT_897060 [Fibularhizoctonia sp. CBS 109695]